MKKIIFNALAFCAVASCLSADITSSLGNYKSLFCTFEERVVSDKNDKHHHHHIGKSHPHIPIEQGVSTNWSGYIAATNISSPAIDSVSSISGSWTVPQLLTTPDSTYSAIWVGIDGSSSTTVEQLGTEHDWIDGVQQNSAWFEMYPNPSYNINGFPVDIGDVIEAEVSYIHGNQFTLSLVNHTKGSYTVIPSNMTRSSVAQRSSAEWIVEAPYSSEVLPLSDFQTVAFSNCTTKINGTSGGITNPGWQADLINMATNSGVVKATTSNLSNNENFTVTWEHE